MSFRPAAITIKNPSSEQYKIYMQNPVRSIQSPSLMEKENYLDQTELESFQYCPGLHKTG